MNIPRSLFLIHFIILIGIALPRMVHSSLFCTSVFVTPEVKNETKWTYENNRVSWVELDSNKKIQFYASAAISPAGIMYFNLKLVSEDGTSRTTQLSGKNFVQIAKNHFEKQGTVVSGIRGWWVFRLDDISEVPLSEQIEKSPFISVNFNEYWNNRRYENDHEAAAKTWTAKLAAELGFTKIASIFEYDKRANYRAILVTFVPELDSLVKIRRAILRGKEEIEVPILKSFEDLKMGEEPTYLPLRTLRFLNLDQSTLIKIVETNSQTAMEFKALGFKIVEVITSNEPTEISLRIRE